MLKVENINIAISNKMNDIPVNNEVSGIRLEFNHKLSLSDAIKSIKIYRLGLKWKLIKENCIIDFEKGKTNIINIRKKDEIKFEKGEAYHIVISRNLKSLEGESLEKDFVGYFAINNSFSFSNASELEGRKQIVVISDLHLGIDDSFSECNKNKEILLEFLNEIGKSPNIKELVIAGDLLDGWFLPMDYKIPESQSIFFDLLAKNNQKIIDGFNNIIKAGNIDVIYVPGNHDILVTEEDINRIFPGIRQVRDNVQGLGTYITGVNSEIVIEHGHRYNFFCAPDQISNRKITNNSSSILPPGYFFTRIATSSIIEGRPCSKNYLPDIDINSDNEGECQKYIYYRVWKGLMEYLPVNENFDNKVIKTDIDGYKDVYSINDLIPYLNEDGILDMNLYKGIHETWEERQKLNGVNVNVSVKDAIGRASKKEYTDDQANKQFFEHDKSKRIVIFGHSHAARILPFFNSNNKKSIYANTGTWIDDAKEFDTRTFVVISPAKKGSSFQFVNLYKYISSGTIVQCADAQTIRT